MTPVARKDIARWLDVSVDVIRKNEKQLGLKAARADINARLIRYNGALVRKILIDRGLLSANTV